MIPVSGWILGEDVAQMLDHKFHLCLQKQKSRLKGDGLFKSVVLLISSELKLQKKVATRHVIPVESGRSVTLILEQCFHCEFP